MKWVCPGCENIAEREEGLIAVYCVACLCWRRPVRQPRRILVAPKRTKRRVLVRPVAIEIEECPYRDHLFAPPDEAN